MLAYSTMSQIGYMFTALGVQAWDAAIFHLMTHAFFKRCCSRRPARYSWPAITNGIFKMGGLRKSIPLVYACFTVGARRCQRCRWSLPGFFSKDEMQLWRRDGERSYQSDGGRAESAFARHSTAPSDDFHLPR